MVRAHCTIMDCTRCRFCERKFYSSSNRSRHEAQIHNNSKVDRADSEMEDDENQEIESGEDYWSSLIVRTFDEMDLQSEIENGNEILGEPILSQFLEELRENLEKRMKFAQYMEEEDETYREIQNTANQYKDLDSDEAFEKAWNERKYLLKRLLRDHMDVIEDEIENRVEVSENEDGNEEEEDENGNEDVVCHIDD